MKELSIKICNETIKKMYERKKWYDELDFNRQKEMLKYDSPREIVGNILFGYLDSFLEITSLAGMKLDLTYDTIDQLSEGLMLCYMSEKKGDNDVDYAKDIVIKTIASYLTLLMINMHGTKFKARQRASASPDLWANHFLLTMDDINLLQICNSAMNDSMISADSGFCLGVAQIVEAYKKLTAVDLSDTLYNIILPLE